MVDILRSICRASPRLKDAQIPQSSFPALYAELILTTRRMYHECKLVHADLSEYNILHHVDSIAKPEPLSPNTPQTKDSTGEGGDHQGHLCIIDVSQSVEHDHPHAFDFLRSDLRNVEDFFSKRGVRCLGLRRAFEFVTKDSFESEGGDSLALESRLQEEQPESLEEDLAPEHASENGKSQADEDSVFMRSYIPRTLNEVYDPERDVGALNRGEGEKLIYKDTIGIVTPKETKVRFEGEDEHSNSEDDESEDSDPEGEDVEGEGGPKQDRKPRGHRHEDREAKKVGFSFGASIKLLLTEFMAQERKKAVKEEAREKRKNKIPKAEKKKKIKATARGK